MRRHLVPAIAVLLPALVWLLPTDWLPITDLSTIEHRVLAVFVFAVAFWVLEPIPIYATSVLIVCLLLYTASDGGIKVLVTSGDGAPGLGQVLSYKALMHSFAEPTIMLFLGGFFLAMAATKYQLDVNLARVLIKPFGESPSRVMLGLMMITALFSMFMSNTAATAMMLAVLTPILAAMPAEDRGRIGLVLCVPFAANIGGIGTPIGTPPNAIAMKYLTGEQQIGFAHWMLFAVPYVLVLLTIAWLMLGRTFRPASARLQIDFSGRWRRDKQAKLVYLIFALTILLWLTGPFHGISSTVVAMLPVAVFSATGIINAADLKRLSWDVIWLIAGGFALGYALESSGLSASLIAAVPLDVLSVPALLVIASSLTLAMATFMSHTAAANLLLPIFAALGPIFGDRLGAFGGITSVILCATFAASLGMALPISTPPNAMAHASGLCSSRQMALVGAPLAIIGWLLTFGMLAILVATGSL